MEQLIFEVGAGKKYTSLSALLLELKDDARPKTILLSPGVYDIYREYRELKVATPPDDVTAGDYLDRCIFLPPNTKLVGLYALPSRTGTPAAQPQGAVLLWNPPKDEITVGEARVWSPLNVRYGCEVEDLTIICHYGRYCIHDDSHNAEEDRGVEHIYRNVNCVYQYSEDRKGFNNTIGFGFSQKNEYLFEDCTFVMMNCPEDSLHHSAFYGHAASGKELEKNDGPKITVKNCKMLGGEGNNRTVRLQSLNRCKLRVKTKFEDCEIQGGLHLTLYYEDAMQAFDVELKNSGRPALLIDQEEKNDYKVKVK